MGFYVGINTRNIYPWHAIRLLKDALDCNLYSRIDRVIDVDTKSTSEYTTNEALCNDLLSGKNHNSVVLREFYLTEWAPQSPGMYFTADGAASRSYAKRYFRYSRAEFVPLGEGAMILGGVGSLRLKPREIDGKEYFIFGATASRITYEGIAVLCTQEVYLFLINQIKQREVLKLI
jgi:hypothetical protein